MGNSNGKGTCFVVMGFGKKTDFETGRVLDLDMSYKNMIKPAVEAAGLECIRADEIVHSGMIDVPMYEQLFNADVVVADLSTSNKNALYELGVRHALRPFTTIVIAEDGIKAFPFDVNRVLIRQYHHLGEDIGFGEVKRFSEQLTNAIKEIVNKDPRDKDSPIYSVINGLTPPAMAAAVQAAVQNAISLNKEAATQNETAHPDNAASEETHSVIMQQVDEAQKRGDWITAKLLLSVIRQMMMNEKEKAKPAEDPWGDPNKVKLAEDPYILQRLALATYKSKIPTEKDALLEADGILDKLNPDTSNDTETLGLWGAVHKRLWELAKEPNYLDDAIRAYERGFYIKNDYYNGINYAYLLNVRAAVASDPAEAIADFVEAKRVRKEVLTICEQWLQNYPAPDKDTAPESAIKSYLNSWYWVKATMGEAYVGSGDDAKAQEILDEAYAKAPATWMQQSTEEQLGKLRPLLADSPLKNIKTS
jgi:tetratricopeptide (TPR) repeat protein